VPRGPGPLFGQGVQDVDRPAHVQTLAEPARGRRPRVEAEPLRTMPCSEDLDGLGGDCSGRRDCGQVPAVRSPEAELAVRLSSYLIALYAVRVVPASPSSRR